MKHKLALLVVGLTCLVFSNCGGGADGDGGPDTTDYEGSGQLLSVTSAILADCSDEEKSALQAEGLSRVYYGSVRRWSKIYTIQGSPMLTQAFVDKVGDEVKRAFEPIIERYPERLRRVLDREGRTINFILVHGSTQWGAYYNGDLIFAKRASATDLDIFHEIGHYFDMDDSPGNWRKHVDSVLMAEDADAIDQVCPWTDGSGKPIYGEFFAEMYGKMFYPNMRSQVESEFPVVFERLLKYVPAPSSYVPFE